MAGRPELCVVVLSYHNEETVLEAVDSLLGQDEPLEVLVSHSGGGPTPELIATRPGVGCVAVGERRLPGAARNAGIAATSAPIVGFLAADCLASSGWAQARLRRHRAGAKAVASALGPLDGGISSRAMWLNEHSPRLPLARPAKEALHGVSYDREVLERQGPFREDLLIGEDTTYNQALEASGVEIEWAPEVVALHRYPTSPLGAIADGYVRGLRRGRQKGLALTRSHLLKSALRAPTLGAARALRPEVPLSATQVAGALPLMAACSVAKAGGVLIARA